MKIEIGNIFRTNEGDLYTSEVKLDTETFAASTFGATDISAGHFVFIYPDHVKEVYTRKTHPEYYL